eukprot:6117682-Prymnesium_polylepis.1
MGVRGSGVADTSSSTVDCDERSRTQRIPGVLSEVDETLMLLPRCWRRSGAKRLRVIQRRVNRSRSLIPWSSAPCREGWARDLRNHFPMADGRCCGRWPMLSPKA